MIFQIIRRVLKVFRKETIKVDQKSQKVFRDRPYKLPICFALFFIQNGPHILTYIDALYIRSIQNQISFVLPSFVV